MSTPPEDGCDVPSEALEDVSHLARSENRVRILTALVEAPARRRELEDRVDVARATAGRVLADFEEREWVEQRTDGAYQIRPAGERLAAEFMPLVERVAAIRRLGDTVAWLPTDEVPIDLRAFRDATILRPERADPLAPAARLTSLLEDTSEFHCLVGIAPALEFERQLRDRVVDGSLTVETVLTAEGLSHLRDDPDRRKRWRDCVNTPSTSLYRYDDPIPCNVLVFDDTVVIGNSQAGGRTASLLVESDRAEVRDWALELIAQYRRRADRVDPDTFVSGEDAD